jgi:hypothetical protein
MGQTFRWYFKADALLCIDAESQGWKGMGKVCFRAKLYGTPDSKVVLVLTHTSMERVHSKRSLAFKALESWHAQNISLPITKNTGGTSNNVRCYVFFSNTTIRYGLTANVNDRNMRETYLYPFIRAIEVC